MAPLVTDSIAIWLVCRSEPRPPVGHGTGARISPFTRPRGVCTLFQYFRIRRLKKLIESEGDYVRAKAAEELGKTKSDMAIAPLIDAMRTNQSHHVHSAAIDALCQIRSRRCVQRVTSLLTDTDVDIRCRSAIILKSIGDSGAVGPLRACLEDRDPSVRRCAVDVLAAIGTPGAIEGIRRIMNDDDQGVRRRVDRHSEGTGSRRRRRNWRSSGPSTTEITGGCRRRSGLGRSPRVPIRLAHPGPSETRGGRGRRRRRSRRRSGREVC